MKYLKFIMAISALSIALLGSGCNKDCYNPSLEKENANKICTADCPGVTGCDDKTYCNECEANKRGVAVKK